MFKIFLQWFLRGWDPFLKIGGSMRVETRDSQSLSGGRIVTIGVLMDTRCYEKDGW